MSNTLNHRPLFLAAALFSSLFICHSVLAHDDYDENDGDHGRHEHRHSQNRDRDQDENRGSEDRGTFADVIQATPLTEEVEVRTPHRECHEEEVSQGGNDGHGGAVLGAIAGGALGNAAGHNTQSRRLDTIAGAIGGAIIGKKMSESDGTTTTEVRCHRRNSVDYEDRVVGYDVTYRYAGREYKSRMDQEPGDRIRVVVDVHPAE